MGHLVAHEDAVGAGVLAALEGAAEVLGSDLEGVGEFVDAAEGLEIAVEATEGAGDEGVGALGQGSGGGAGGDLADEDIDEGGDVAGGFGTGFDAFFDEKGGPFAQGFGIDAFEDAAGEDLLGMAALGQGVASEDEEELFEVLFWAGCDALAYARAEAEAVAGLEGAVDLAQFKGALAGEDEFECQEWKGAAFEDVVAFAAFESSEVDEFVGGLAPGDAEIAGIDDAGGQLDGGALVLGEEHGEVGWINDV